MPERSADWNVDLGDAPSTSSSSAPSSYTPPPAPPPPAPPSPALLRRRRLAGLACVGAVATVWAGASFVVAGVEAAGLPPLALTYIANSLFVLYLPAYFLLRARREKKRRKQGLMRPGYATGQPLDDFSSSGTGAPKLLSDAEEASFPLVPRPREGPREIEGGGGSAGREAPAPSPPSPGPPAPPPPTPSGGGGPTSAAPAAAAAPLFSPANSRLLAAMDSCLSRLLPASTTAAEAEEAARRGGRRRCGFLFSFYLSREERAVALAALAVAPLWFGAQLSFNASLARTSVTSNTILSTASSLFTYALAVLLLGEPATARRALSVAACVAGVAAVALADSVAERGGRGGSSSSSDSSHSSSRNRTLAGDALVLLSCTLYAGYTVAVRALLVDEDGGAATMLFFGLVGLFNLVFGLPLVALALLVPGTRLFSAAGRAAALNPKLVAAAAAKGLLDNVLSDYLWARAVLLIGATVATVGLNVQVPLAAGLDAAFGRPKPAWTRSGGAAALTAAGAVAVVGGVCGIAAEEPAATGTGRGTP